MALKSFCLGPRRKITTYLIRSCSTAAEGRLDRFVPNCHQTNHTDILRLQNILDVAEKLVVLTGAGVSTESGIPENNPWVSVVELIDYRSAGIGLYTRTNRRPVLYQDFVRSPAARQRYWARNFVGWPQFSSFRPNPAHMCIAEWEKSERFDYLVTQNVDELHLRAGSQKCIELHGSSHRVTCLSCDTKMARADFQKVLQHLNPQCSIDFLQEQLAPDGDVLLPDSLVQNFKVPDCEKCGGTLKPDLVFFGDNVAGRIVDKVYQLIDDCDTLLVAGSSLFVYSGYRFVVRAHKQGKQIAIVNIGNTRADDLANIKVEGRCSDILTKISF